VENGAKNSDHDLIDAARKTADQFASLLGSATPATELFPGYDVVRQIGRGGQGVVYEAVQRATKRHVAIKAIRGGAFVTPHERIRFRREVEFAARLQHPNIVSVLDSGIHQGNDFFVMEYVQGSRIDQIETPGAGPVRDTLGRLAAICDVVDYAHQRGVLHRDLKPSNVIIDERGQPHILDFGLAIRRWITRAEARRG
jgi:serine/threonine-protein kinase